MMKAKFHYVNLFIYIMWIWVIASLYYVFLVICVDREKIKHSLKKYGTMILVAPYDCLTFLGGK